MRTGLAAILLLAPALAPAHRLDEYLQETLISLGKERLQAQIMLTPGVAVLPIVMAEIDADGDGAVSDAEQRAYARHVLRDLSLTIDGRPLAPQLVSERFPAMDEMKEGMGAIRIEFQADLPHGGALRRLVFENRHQKRVGAYLVNCLVPVDPDIRVVGQQRNYSQSVYTLEYRQRDARAESMASGWWSDDRAWLAALALLLLARLAFLVGSRRLAA
ncbi:MAG TPA: hypothetical protein VGF59_10470 [Bryobacteraceae bacterium]